MHHFKNELKTDVSLSYNHDDVSHSKLVKAGSNFALPDDFIGPVSIGISEKTGNVTLSSAEENGDTPSNP